MSRGPARLLVVTGSLDIGGTEQHLTQVLPRLDRDRVHAHVFLLRGGGALQPLMEEGGVTVHVPGGSRRGLAGVALAAAALARLRWRLRPHLVHFFLPEAYMVGAACGLLAPRAVELMSRRSLNVYQAKYPGARGVERLLHRRMRAVLGNSHEVVAELLEEGVATERLGLIPNGVDLARFDVLPSRRDAERALGIAPSTLRVVCVANLIGYKGHADLLRALASAAPRLPPGWEVALVGRDGGIGASLRRLASEFDIAAHARWVGQVHDVAPWLAAADLGVLASHEEGFSNSLVEMMAARLPVVATRVGGTPDAVEHGVSGLLVEPRDVQGLGDELARLAADGELRDRLGAAARASAVARFSIERCVRRYESLYDGLLGSSATGVQALIGAADNYTAGCAPVVTARK